MSYSGFTPGLNFGFDPGKVNITNLKYGSPIGGMTNRFSGENLFPFMSTPEYQNAPKNIQELMFLTQPKSNTLNLDKIEQIMTRQADIASKVAREKYNQEFMGQGIGALAGGLKTLFAGGSPEMIAYLSQTPERGATAYLEGYNSVGPRQNAIPRTYGSSTRRSYFNT